MARAAPAAWVPGEWAAPAAKPVASRVIFSLVAMPVAPQGPAVAAGVAADPVAVLAAVAAAPVAALVVVPGAEVVLAVRAPVVPAHGPAAVPA